MLKKEKLREGSWNMFERQMGVLDGALSGALML
jgi:hypothetical protein